MNLFLVHLSPGGSASRQRLAAAVDTLLAEIPFLRDPARTSWEAPSGRCALATASHAPEQVGGVRYVAVRDDRVAAFTGRPFVWTDELEADGRAALAPEFYLRPATEWIDRIDGRWAALRYDDEKDELEMSSDPLGSYPIYTGGEGERFFSNSPELIRRLVGTGGSSRSRVSVLAGFFASGAAMDGAPRWEEVDRLPAGVQRFAATDGVRRGPSTIDWLPLLGDRFDVEIASRRLVAIVRALSDWPGRPTYLSLSGGRDSRLVFAAAVAAKIDVSPRTMTIPGAPGYPETKDILLARALCEAAGVGHEIIEPVRAVPPARSGALLGLLSPGASSLELAAQAAFARTLNAGEPIEIVQTGHCGEVARAHYGVSEGEDAAALTDRLVSRVMPSVPRPLLSRDGKAIYRALVADWVERQLEAGAPASMLPDLFNLDHRMPHWIAVSQGVSEYVHDLANPLWSRRLIPQALGFTPAQRRQELFHLQLLERLAPALLEIPFDVEPLAHRRHRDHGMSAGRARTLAKLRREMRRSLWGYPGPDLLPEIAAHLRLAVESDSGHASWEVLDRRRVHELLRRNARTLDRRSRSMIWRLATVFLAEEHMPATAAPRVAVGVG